MATRMSRLLTGSLRGRLYSTQAAVKDTQKVDVVDKTVNNVRVAVADNGGAVSRMTFIVKAGSRYENGSNLGVSHLIRHITHLSTAENTTYKFLKDLEISGGNVSTQSTRDYAILSFTCGRNMFSDVFAVCAPAITRSQLNFWDVDEYNLNSKLRTDLGLLQTQPNVELFELIHDAAYIGTLGNSVYMSPRYVGTISPDQVINYMTTNYRAGRTAISAVNISPQAVSRSVEGMNFIDSSAQPNDAKPEYIGGEKRLPVGGCDAVYVAFAAEGPSVSSPQFFSAAVLQNILGGSQRVKYGGNNSKLATAVQKVTDAPFAVDALNANYTDSGLFGFTVAADSANIEKVLRTTLTAFAETGRSGVTDEEVQRAKNQLKANIAMQMESEEGLVANLAEQAIGSGNILSVNQLMQKVDAVTTSDVVNAAKKLTSGKPSYASVGDLTNVPRLDQLLK